MVMDEVQLSDSAFQNRNLFLSPDGKQKYLTISFNKKNYLQRKIRELEITNPSWQTDHRKILSAYYGKYPYFKDVMPFIEPLFAASYSLLFEPVWESMKISFSLLAIPARLVLQSSMDYDRMTQKSDLVLSLVRAMSAGTYLSGTGAQDYMDVKSFELANIRVVYNSFTHPIYPQKCGPQFQAGMSCLDLLFNCGIERAREIFWDNVRKGSQK
jgi:hypothetical protein